MDDSGARSQHAPGRRAAVPLPQSQGKGLDMTSFRCPERLGAFSLWIAPEIYPLVEAAKMAGEQHRALLRERVLLSLPGERVDLTQDEEFLQSATSLFRRFEELWAVLEREQSLN